MAERQAKREEELAQAHHRASQAEARAEDLDQDLALVQQQVAALKEVSLLLPFLSIACLLKDLRRRLVTSEVALGTNMGPC